ncbi:MAG TPA: TonB-dependent receptor, partial [Longimicrobium sp.]
APDPYTAVQSYTVDKVTLGEKTVNGIRTSAYGNPNLKPERGEEFELGFDLGIMDGRMGAEFTYYDKQMNDVIVLVALPPSGGFPVSRFENLGSTRNSGVELGLTGTPVRSRAFTWDTRVNLATNRNRLESFGTATKVFEAVGSQAYIPAGATVRQEHRAGYPLAGYWVIGPQRDENGNIKYNAAGTAVVLDSVRTYGGTPVPTREVGFSNTFTLFQNLRVYSLFDYRGGHHLMNFKEYNRCVSNANCKLVNDPQATPQEIARARSDATMYLERADFVKLRDLSLTYTLPSRVLRVAGASDLSFTLAGHNLALWSDYSGLDPEVNTGANRSFVRTDAYAAPMTRRYSVSVNLSY